MKEESYPFDNDNWNVVERAKLMENNVYRDEKGILSIDWSGKVGRDLFGLDENYEKITK